MTFEVQCLTCNKPIAKVATERNVFRRTTEITVWCHGTHATLEVGATRLMLNEGSTIRLTAFPKPTRLIVDRDMGDEDPAEPWQGDVCQM